MMLGTRKDTYITTEVDIEDYSVIEEELIDIALASTVKRHHRRSPACGIRCTGRDIGWDASALKEPVGNTGALPKRGVDAAPVLVEVVAVAVLVGGRDAAAVVAVIGVAVRVQECVSCC